MSYAVSNIDKSLVRSKPIYNPDALITVTPERLLEVDKMSISRSVLSNEQAS